MLTPGEADEQRFSEEKFVAALTGWKQGARSLGTETVISLLALWIAATQGGIEWFFYTLTVCAFIVVLRHARNRRITENFEHVLQYGESQLCRVHFQEDSGTVEPGAVIGNAFTGQPIGRFRLLIHESQIEPIIAATGDQFEFYVRSAFVDGKIYALISTGRELICAISTK